MNKKETFQKLLFKYNTGNCTQDEVRQMVRLLEEDPELYSLLDAHINHDWWIQSLSETDKPAEKPEPSLSVEFFKRAMVWRIAAGIAILVAAGVIWWMSAHTGTIQYATDYGERLQIELPDGSQVELNANSHLTWNKNWKRSGIRSVVLDGEAYFDVVKSKDRQFKVTADETVVRVLGTSFNVSSRRGDTEVFLKEGKVKLEVPDQPVLTMVPGEKVLYDKQEKKIQKTVNETLYSAAAWRTGVISYQKTSLKEILPELGDIYGVRLICQDSTLNEKIMDVGVPYMDWEATKESLELSMKVTIEKEGEDYVIRNIE